MTGSYLLSAQGRTPLVELLLSLLSPDLKGKHAFLLTFCNSLHGHSTIWLAVRKSEVFSVINSLAHSYILLMQSCRRECARLVSFPIKIKAEHSELVTSSCLCGSLEKKSPSPGCECVLMWDCPTSFLIHDCTTQAEGNLLSWFP